jgi:hypothetical protein
MKIFAGNLSGETTGDDLRHAFESFGQCHYESAYWKQLAAKD